jgi:PAS domain S-box-containing protein
MTEAYLKPSGITSMMDVPVTGAGSRWGIICHEHIGPPRHWTSDEQSFALAVTNLIWAVIEHAERRGLEARLRDYMDGALDCMTILSPGLRILYANQAWHHVTGYTADDLAAGVRTWHLIHPSRHRELKEYEARLTRGESVHFTDLEGVGKDGHELIAEGTARPKLALGRLEYVYVVWRDVIREKQKRALPELFRRPFGSHLSLGFRRPLPISLPVEDQLRWVGEHAYFAECNSATARIFEAERAEDIVGLPLRELFRSPRSCSGGCWSGSSRDIGSTTFS